jgi:hypothetical protein
MTVKVARPIERGGHSERKLSGWFFGFPSVGVAIFYGQTLP